MLLVGTVLTLVTALAAPAAAYVPLGIEVAPGSKRCVHETVERGEEGVVELFVESGGRLMVHLTVEGPMTSGWDGIPEKSKATDTFVDKTVTNDAASDFADSFTTSFESKGGAYQVCVANDMNKITPKVVQLSVRQRGKSKAASDKALKLQSPKVDNKLSPEDQAAAEIKEREVSSLEASVKKLKSGLRKVRDKQMQERHRQAAHTAVNQDSNNHMVVGSLIETVVFIGTASFQIIFVRNWFEGKGAQQWA